MKREYDFSKARRGPLVPKDPSKTLITIPLDNHVLDYLAKMIDRSGGGSFENLVNNVLRDLVAICERAPVEESELFLKRAARGGLPRALEVLARTGADNSPRPDDRIIERPSSKPPPIKRTTRRAVRSK